MSFNAHFGGFRLGRGLFSSYFGAFTFFPVFCAVSWLRAVLNGLTR
jgi:hypothetical protein